MGLQGRIQDFPKGGVETRDTKCRGGGGCCPLKAQYKNRGGCCPALQARCKKRGGGGGYLAEEGGGTLYERGVANPNPISPPPPPPPQIRLWFDVSDSV